MADPIRAEVVLVDDPLNRGRVKIRCPALGAEWEGWAEVLRPYPAAPPPTYAAGAVVMILFEGGDPDFPIVLGALSSDRDLPGAELATKLPQTDYERSNLGFPAETLAQLDQIVAATEARATRGREWVLGSLRRDSPAVLFSGPAGTGKTLTAQILAKELGVDLYRVELSRVISRYIGETEKNLQALFAAAEASGAVLFFDEAEALFGKRSDVKDSHDRYANVETSWLLQRLEAHRGLVILATNRKQAIDPAFTRRLAAIVDFPMPDPAHRGG